MPRPIEHPCRCRNCDKIYNELKATGSYKGYCTQRCVTAKAKSLGYSRKAWEEAQSLAEKMRLTMYGILKQANEIGSIRLAGTTKEVIDHSLAD